MELLESVGPRPRQARYQAALRPDMIDFNSSLVWEIMAKTLIEISEPSHSENRRWLYKETECASFPPGGCSCPCETVKRRKHAKGGQEKG